MKLINHSLLALVLISTFNLCAGNSVSAQHANMGNSKNKNSFGNNADGQAQYLEQLLAHKKAQRTQLQKNLEELDEQIAKMEDTLKSFSNVKSRNSRGDSEESNQNTHQVGTQQEDGNLQKENEIPGTIEAIFTPNKTGSGGLISCPQGYMYYKKDFRSKTVCIPRPSNSSSTTVTPGNVPIKPTKIGNNTTCPENYTLTRRDVRADSICEPNITEVMPGVYSCLFGSPSTGANGLMECK